MDEIRLEELNIRCSRCGGLVPFWGDSCLSCGQVAHPPHRLRIMGGIYLVIGLGLSGAIIYLMVLIAGIIRHSSDAHATTRFNGTPAQVVMIFGVLTFPLLVGFTLIVTGVWQLRYGRRNLKLVRLAFIWLYVLIGASLLPFGADLLRFLTHR